MTPAVIRAFDARDNCAAVSYINYWGDLTAQTDADVFRRFLFAFCSVHTSWESNVAGYCALRDFELWLGDREALRSRLVASGVGLYNNRTKFIGDFAEVFWAGPCYFRRRPRESWGAYRDRLEHNILGLGPAKTSFALELAFPLEAEVLCLDVHMLRMYGKRGQSMKVGEYERYEHDWLGRSRAVELPSYIVKQIHWDSQQGRSDSRYWSHVLES